MMRWRDGEYCSADALHERSERWAYNNVILRMLEVPLLQALGSVISHAPNSTGWFLKSPLMVSAAPWDDETSVGRQRIQQHQSQKQRFHHLVLLSASLTEVLIT